MFKNYLKIAFRHISKSRFYTAVTVLGLSLSFTFCFLTAAYVWREYSVNLSLKNAGNQYIVQSNWKDPNMGIPFTTVGPLAKSLREQYPDLVANYYRWDGITSTVSKGDRIFREGLQVGDSTLLTMYGFALLQGDARTALTEPFSVVITEDRAVKYFGRKDVVGETLTIESFSGTKHDFKITGVMKMAGQNSVTHLTPENDNQFYIPVASAAYFNRKLDEWDNPYRVAYVELQPGIQPQDLQKPMQDFLNKNAPPQVAANMRPFITPLKTFYLDQNNGLVKTMLWIVSAIALFILLMAIVNFINLSIGQASSRLKEIGVRKVMGSRKRQLVQQFLTESTLLAILSSVVGLIGYAIAQPLFSDVLDKELPSVLNFPLWMIFFPLLLAVLIGVAAGSYPAFVLARVKTTESVKGKQSAVGSNILLRKSLVAFQAFVASVVFAGAFVIMQQVELFFSKKLGYDKDYIVSVQTPRDWTAKGVQQMMTVRNELASMPEVKELSLSWSVPNGMSSGSTPVFTNGKDSSSAVGMETISTDEHYLDVFRIPLKAGRFFSGLSDTSKVVMNETAVKALGFSYAASAVGQEVRLGGPAPFQIIGVVNDFHFGSMKAATLPLLMMHVARNDIYRLLSFKLRAGNIPRDLAAVEKRWSNLLPGSAFDYTFMDDALKRLYAAEIQLKKAVQLAVILAIVIVLLGISGLVSISIQKRTKEIGVRKIVGASAINIISIFLTDFLPVVLLGGLLAMPVSWYLMRGWLNDYAYRIAVTPLPFLVPVTVIVGVAAILIALQTTKTANENPVKSLRTE